MSLLTTKVLGRSGASALVCALTSVATCGGAFAQNVTSPAGFHGIEGNGSLIHFAGSWRHQQIDDTHSGTTLAIRGIAFRRDGAGGGVTAAARTFALRVRMDEVDMSQLSFEFEPNLTAPTTVFPRQAVSVPDWTPAVGVPAPFDFIVPFATPWNYTGDGSLLIDFDFDNNSSANGVVLADFEEVRPNHAPPNFVGPGCPHSARPGSPVFAFLTANSGMRSPDFGMRMITRVYNGVPNSPFFVHLGLSNPGLTAPGLCGTLYADPIVTLYLGDTGPFGFIDFRWLSFPYVDGLIGVELFAQGLQLEPNSAYGIPVVLSGGVSSVMPDSPLQVPECAYHFEEVRSVPENVGADLFFGAGLIIELRL